MQGWLEDPLRDGNRIYNPGYVRVNPALRNRGIGQRLIEASLAYAVDHGATQLRASVVNDFSLKVLAKLLGDDIEYKVRDQALSSYRLMNIPITNQQAIESLARAGLIEEDPEDRSREFLISADLTKLDTSNWERPGVQT